MTLFTRFLSVSVIIVSCFCRCCPGLSSYVRGPLFPQLHVLLASKTGSLNSQVSSSRLSLNSCKTQFGTTQYLQKRDLPLLSHRFPHFIFLSPVHSNLKSHIFKHSYRNPSDHSPS